MSNRKLTASEIREWMPRMPFNSLLGFKLTRVHADGVTIECAPRPELLNAAGVVHGGVTATMADAAVGIALTRHFGGTRPVTTVERSYLVRMGSSLCVGRVSDSRKRLVGAALVTYMVMQSAGTGRQ